MLMFVFSLKYNVLPIRVAEPLRQLFKADWADYTPIRNLLFFLATSEEEKKEASSSSERSCYQAAQWLWLSILITREWSVFCACINTCVYLKHVWVLFIYVCIYAKGLCVALLFFTDCTCTPYCACACSERHVFQPPPVRQAHCDLNQSQWSRTHAALHPVTQFAR